MNNAVGLPDADRYANGTGRPVALGDDGFSNDAYPEVAAAIFAHRLASGDPQKLPGEDVMRMAMRTTPGWRHTSTAKPGRGFDAGAYADIAFLDYPPPTPLMADNLPWHIIFGVDGSKIMGEGQGPQAARY